MRQANRGAILLTAAAVGWLATLLIGSHVIFPAGAFICHQRPERSFFIGGQQMAVCARCAGLYSGAALAAPFALVMTIAATARAGRWTLLIAALPTAITWTLEFAGVAPFSNLARFFAGLPLGFAAAWLVLQTVKTTSRSEAITARH